MRNNLILNEDEIRCGRISLYNMLEIYGGQMVLCNNVPQVDYELEWEDYSLLYSDNNKDYPVDIYQYFIVTESYKDLFNKLKYPVAYSNVLDVWIVGITHCGMGWDYIMTSIPIEDYNNWFENYDEYKKIIVSE